MPALSNLGTQRLFEQIAAIAAWTAPTEIWLGLSTAAPAADSSNLYEVVGNPRIDVTGLWTVDTATPVSMWNTTVVNIGPLEVGTYTHVFLTRSELATDFWLATAIRDQLGFPTSITTTAGETVQLPAEALFFEGDN